VISFCQHPTRSDLLAVEGRVPSAVPETVPHAPLPMRRVRVDDNGSTGDVSPPPCLTLILSRLGCLFLYVQWGGFSVLVLTLLFSITT
jgi:hypothetical protein